MSKEFSRSGEMKSGLATQTYVILVGWSAMLAGAITLIYVALFAGGAG